MFTCTHSFLCSQFADLDDAALSSTMLELVTTRLVPGSTSWTCYGQFLVLAAEMRMRSDVLGILATGSGKTIASILPTILEPEKCVVVILPLRSLLWDYKRKLDAINIPYQTWAMEGTKASNANPLSSSVNLILVLVEQAKKREFRTALINLNDILPVSRIVIDEPQYALTATDYRDALKHMNEIRTVSAQLILLSATIPPTSTSTIRTLYGLDPFTTVVRTSTIRPEVEYILHPPVDAEDLPAMVRRLIDGYRSQFAPEDRGLIWVRSVKDAEHYASDLQVLRYHGTKDNDSSYTERDQLKAMQQWASGQPPIMACTSGFASGNDYPSVRVSIHVEIPFEFMDGIQQLGRIGRDHRHAIAHIVPKRGLKRPPTDSNEHKGAVPLWEMAYGSGRARCVREQISKWADGQGIPCTADSALVKCSNCSGVDVSNPLTLRYTVHKYTNEVITSPHDAPPPTAGDKRSANFDDLSDGAKRQRTDRMVAEETYITNLKSMLDQYAATCVACVTHDKEPMDHAQNNREIIKCTHIDLKDYFVFKGWRYVNMRDVCFRCHVPQLRRDLHAQNVAGKTPICPHPDVIGPAVYLCWKEQELRQEAATYFGQTWTSNATYQKWLGQKGADPHATNAVAMFLWWAEKMSRRTLER